MKMTNTLLLVSISPSTSSKLCRLSLLLLLIVALMAFSTVVASPQSLESNQKFTQCIRLAEILSGEGINVSQQVELLNKAIVYLEANQTEAALPLLDEAYQQLSVMYEKLPSVKLRENLERGAVILALAATPALFYYFFPRLYALVWLYNRRSYIVRHNKKARK